MKYKQDVRRQRVLDRLVMQVDDKTLSKEKVSYLKGQIDNLLANLAGRKRTKRKAGVVVEQSKDRYYIDIYSISMHYVKNSVRRKKENKGKSKKKLKQVKSVNFVRSVVLQPGMIQAYKEGRMGLSPRTHKFTVRRDENYSV